MIIEQARTKEKKIQHGVHPGRSTCSLKSKSRLGYATSRQLDLQESTSGLINDCGLKSSSLIQFWVQLSGMNKGCSAIQPEPGPVSRPVTYSSSSLAPLYFLHQDKGFMNQIPHLHYAMLDRPSFRTNPVHRSSCFYLCASRRNPSFAPSLFSSDLHFFILCDG